MKKLSVDLYPVKHAVLQSITSNTNFETGSGPENQATVELKEFLNKKI
jgi:hypothetical protein